MSLSLPIGVRDVWLIVTGPAASNICRRSWIVSGCCSSCGTYGEVCQAPSWRRAWKGYLRPVLVLLAVQSKPSGLGCLEECPVVVATTRRAQILLDLLRT